MTKTIAQLKKDNKRQVDIQLWHSETAIEYMEDCKNIDSGNKKIHDFNYIRLCNLYLTCSHLYYDYDKNILADTNFDKLCFFLLEHHDMLELSGVYHVEENITVDNLLAGTCIGVDYPDSIRAIASQIVDRLESAA